MILNTLLQLNFNKDLLKNVGFIIFIILIIYFFTLRPQRKKYNEQKSLLQNLKPGMKITTIGGIHGIILTVDDSTVTIELNNEGTNLIIEKTAISVNSLKNDK